MVELVKYMVDGLVDNKDAVEITMEGEDVINVKVDKNDLGKVIGKDGRIAKAIRTVMRATANRSDSKISVEID